MDVSLPIGNYNTTGTVKLPETDPVRPGLSTLQPVGHRSQPADGGLLLWNHAGPSGQPQLNRDQEQALTDSIKHRPADYERRHWTSLEFPLRSTR